MQCADLTASALRYRIVTQSAANYLSLDVRPADAVEAAECWALALASHETPSVIALTRQGVPTVRIEHTSENLSEKGAYVLSHAQGKRQATLIASGGIFSYVVFTTHSATVSVAPNYLKPPCQAY